MRLYKADEVMEQMSTTEPKRAAAETGNGNAPATGTATF